MAEIPPDFGGFLAGWDPDERPPYAYLYRVGHGRVQSAMRFTPLNLLQVRQTLDALIEQGKQEGWITDEHLRQHEQLPTVEGLDGVMPREQVDEIAGPD